MSTTHHNDPRTPADDISHKTTTTSGVATGTSSWPAILTVVAGTILLDGVVLTGAYRDSSPVSDEQLSFPWQGATAVATSVMWGLAQAFLVVGLGAFARHASHAGRRGRVGARLALAGGVVFVAAHAVSALAYDAATDDALAIIAGSLFGLGTVLLAAGLLTAGVAMHRSGTWSRWNVATPLALGGWMAVMIPLQFTAALVVAVGIYAVTMIAFGVALLDATTGRDH